MGIYGLGLENAQQKVSDECDRYKVSMRDLPRDELPREQLKRNGPGKLTTPQLLAIVLRTGNGKLDVLQLAEKLYTGLSMNEMANIKPQELMGYSGIGEAKACQIIAAFELGKRLLLYRSHPVFSRPSEAAFFLIPELGSLPQEHFKCLYLDHKNCLIHDRTMFIGTSAESLVDPVPIFREAILHHASSIILSHNHPSGDPTPSTNDIEITKRIHSAGKLLGIEVFDHIIIGGETFVSLAERGLIPG